MSELMAFDFQYMKKVGVGLLTRKMAANLKPVLEFVIDGNHCELKIISININPLSLLQGSSPARRRSRLP
jgi:hypothetical protein